MCVECFTVHHWMALSWFLDFLLLFFFCFVETPIRFWPTIEQMLLSDLWFLVYFFFSSFYSFSYFSTVWWATLQRMFNKNPWNVNDSCIPWWIEYFVALACRHVATFVRVTIVHIHIWKAVSNKAFHVNGNRVTCCVVLTNDHSILCNAILLYYIEKCTQFQNRQYLYYE